MTIAICLKVGDGVVLGTDSAGSLIGDHGQYYNVYFSTEKSLNLVKRLPIGMVTYGLGGLAGRSIASLGRDLRKRLSGDDPWKPDWRLDPHGYTIEEVAQRTRSFFYDELYVPEYGLAAVSKAKADGDPSAITEPAAPSEDEHLYPSLGFMLAGFSANEVHSEVWTVEIDPMGMCTEPQCLHSKDEQGVISWRGEPEALNRLLLGSSYEAYERLIQAGVSSDVALQILRSYSPLAHPAMPVQDAIDLVQYLADVTVGFVRFKPGPPTVAPPIDIATITRHENFRWIRRKHFYKPELNVRDDRSVLIPLTLEGGRDDQGPYSAGEPVSRSEHSGKQDFGEAARSTPEASPGDRSETGTSDEQDDPGSEDEPTTIAPEIE
ncbi:MAG: hypothetical protein GEU90_03210 [Gemmatimonas sp.]|nr:hypothetical protein [Gemmatimonas sp.]